MLACDSNALRDTAQLFLRCFLKQLNPTGGWRWGLLLAAAGMLMCIAPRVGAQIEIEKVPDARQTRPEKIEKVIVIEFEGEITYERERYFNAKFKQAQQVGCDVLIVEIDSPGGLKIESLKMARLLRDCKWAYTVVFIKNEAISGGALMSLGCDEIHIAPNAKFGDIGEIGFDAEAFAWRLIEPKIESYLSRDARDLAQSKGRPADLAESMVDKDVLVFTKQDADGNSIFTLARVDDEQQPVAPWEIVPESGAERFLTLSGQRAKQLGVAQFFADSRAEVLASFDGGKKSSVVEYRHETTDTIVHWLNTPFITGLLLVGGLIALYFELTAPGIGVGGLISALCATLFFWSRMSGGTSGWLEVILFVAGMTFLVMEIFVIPGTGIAGIGGGMLLLASVVLASQDFVVPQTVWDWNRLLVSLLTVICSLTIFMVAAFFITRSLGSLPLFNRLVLSPDVAVAKSGTDKGNTKSSPQFDQPEVSVGDFGKSKSQLRPSGSAVFNGRSFDVVSDGSFIDPDTPVKVIRIQGNVVTVAEVIQ
jgi:membrane-bound serine protease (ClpP class)